MLFSFAHRKPALCFSLKKILAHITLDVIAELKAHSCLGIFKKSLIESFAGITI